jgi:hypothetical protein
MDMAENGEIKTLIGTLQQLYSRLVEMIIGVRGRIGSTKGGGGSKQDVANLLSDRLDKLAAASEREGESSRGEQIGTDERNSPGVGEQRSHQRPSEGEAAPEFTQHFHDRGADELVGASVGEKIKSRALEHINKALLLARQGDRANARLHAEIANGAVKEASRFMTEGEYQEFVDLITERLSKFEG